MKFGTEVVLEKGKDLEWDLTQYPQPWGTGCVKGVWGSLDPQPCILAKTC